MGRFMSPDAFTYAIKTEPQTWNLYSYVANNPLKRTDPDGHDWFLIDNCGFLLKPFSIPA